MLLGLNEMARKRRKQRNEEETEKWRNRREEPKCKTNGLEGN